MISPETEGSNSFMRIKITSDSTCDLSPELIAENQISIVPLHVRKGAGDFRDGVDITPADIFAHVDAGGALCSTAAVNTAEYEAFFSQFAKDYDAVVHIDISADFSSCYQNACIAAQAFDNVYVIDSRNLSSGHGHVVMEACKMAKNCANLEEMLENLRELTGRVEASFIINRLDYMVKGGRCSMVAALGANLLSLKPCIEVVDGKMQVCKKYRGSYLKCLEKYVTDRLAGRTDLVYERIFITYSTADPEELALVHRIIDQVAPFTEVIETKAGCTVCCHCGPKTLGVLFIRKK